jgi:hypothetical protein
MHHHPPEQPQGVHRQLPLAALDLFFPPSPLTSPPITVLLADWDAALARRSTIPRTLSRP